MIGDVLRGARRRALIAIVPKPLGFDPTDPTRHNFYALRGGPTDRCLLCGLCPPCHRRIDRV